MKIHQVSIFLENKPGVLTSPCRALSNAGINIVTLSLADTKNFGILRLIVRDWEKAAEVLRNEGCVVNVTEVVAVDVPDRPGGMAEVLDVLDKAQVNIEYMYAFTNRVNDRALVVFRFDDIENGIATMEKAGFNVVRPIELFELAPQSE